MKKTRKQKRDEHKNVLREILSLIIANGRHIDDRCRDIADNVLLVFSIKVR